MDDGRLKTGLGKALTGPDEELVLLAGISHAVGAVVVGHSEVLEQAGDIPVLLVWNKVDLAEPAVWPPVWGHGRPCVRISASTGVTPTLIRCPYGEYDDHVISAIRSMGMEPIQWDVDSLDWKDYDADTICQRVTSKLSPGSIVLFHNAALHTPEALPAILDHMAREGYSLLPISQLIYRENYTIDHAGRQFCQAQSEQ